MTLIVYMVITLLSRLYLSMKTIKKVPETKTLIDFAFYFNVSVDYLLGLSDNRDMDKPDKDVNLVSEFITTCNSLFEGFNNDKISREDRDKIFKVFSKLYSNSL